MRDAGSVPGSGRSSGGGNDNPLQYSWLENPMDRGAWQATVHEVAESWTPLKQLSMHAALLILFSWFILCLTSCVPGLRNWAFYVIQLLPQWWRTSNCLVARWFFCTSPRWENIFFCPSTGHCKSSPICNLRLMVFISFPIWGRNSWLLGENYCFCLFFFNVEALCRLSYFIS